MESIKTVLTDIQTIVGTVVAIILAFLGATIEIKNYWKKIRRMSSSKPKKLPAPKKEHSDPIGAEQSDTMNNEMLAQKQDNEQNRILPMVYIIISCLFIILTISLQIAPT